MLELLIDFWLAFVFELRYDTFNIIMCLMFPKDANHSVLDCSATLLDELLEFGAFCLRVVLQVIFQRHGTFACSHEAGVAL